ncbi:LytTR family DNA-binding domain-containing protein [Spirosoma telluris]|uniref:LytR/AlgR family response regulator transcription factor n=1 Tax=Spirosoma telluris TaxID=2183553 RepID=UPI002FC285F5
MADILFIEGLDDYLKIHLQPDNTSKNRAEVPRPIVARMTMKAMMERLPNHSFSRVHRSYIVPLNRIEAIRNKTILLGDREIPIGASYETDLVNRLG